jgi:hypothetical protein
MNLKRSIARANKQARELKRGNSPVSGTIAFMFWGILSGCTIPVSIAKKLYLKAGYKPFSGYPLTHK